MIWKLLPALLAGVLLMACCTSLPKLASLSESVDDPLQVTIYKAPL